MPKSKLSTFVSLLLVFFSGSVLGAFAYRLYTVNPVVTAGKKGPEEFVRQRLAEMRDRVKVDDQQLDQIQRVYNETRQEYDRVHEEMNQKGKEINQRQVEKIKAILKPDQISVYDQIRAEHEQKRREREQQKK